jgi:hypothetical protein
MKLRANLLLACVVLGALLPVFAGEVDHRFEGIWAGVETFQVDANIRQKGDTISKPCLIAIADRGKLVGIVQGLFPARYSVSDKGSGGNKLVFFGGARASTLVLAADGNTLTERGTAYLPGIRGNANTVLQSTVTGTFHRQGKK